MAFEQYVAEEIATDAADGFIPRREALRRLGLLGLTLPAAAALLARFGVTEDRPATVSAAAGAPLAAGQAGAQHHPRRGCHLPRRRRGPAHGRRSPPPRDTAKGSVSSSTRTRA